MKLIIFLFIVLIPLGSAGYIGLDPVDCDSSNREIYFGQVEICNDNIDNNCNGDYTYFFDNDPSTGVDEKDIECAEELGEVKINLIEEKEVFEESLFLSLGKIFGGIFSVFLIE